MHDTLKSDLMAVQRACMFVDYENLISYVKQNALDPTPPKQVIHSLLDSVLHYIGQELKLNLDTPIAYADFASMGSKGAKIQQSLYLAGFEPRFVPASLQSNASEIQICIDAVDTIQKHADLRAILLITGNHLYLPLFKYCQQKNVRGIVITFQPPELDRDREYSEYFLHADRFLNQTIHAHPEAETQFEPSSPSTGDSSSSVENIEITDPTVLVSLEIIEHYFGQYEEIYLTPLLRKLSDMLGGHDDAKSLIGKLEETGAIWLEKRKGYPYNYTVLLINYTHPNVQAIREAAETADYEEGDSYDHLENGSGVYYD